MELEGIINVSGKPGLFKVIYSHNQANLLNEIGIYTYNDTIPLSDIFLKIAEKTKCGPSINHKSEKSDLINYFRDVLPEYDEERVYLSDIKKVIHWYNIMQSVDLIKIPKKKKEKKQKDDEI